MNSISEVLINSQSSSEVIRKIYRLFKDLDKKYTMSFICEKTRIPSTGYFSDVVSQKRRIGSQYLLRWMDLFAFDDLQKEYLLTLYDLEVCKENSEIERLNTELQNLKKTLNIKKTKISNKIRTDLSLSLELFASLGLFQGKANIDDFVDLFKEYEPVRVRSCLDALVESNILRFAMGYYTANDINVLFNSSNDGVSHKELLRSLIATSASGVDRWFDEPELSLYSSELVSVSLHQYKKLLKDFRYQFQKLRCEVEDAQNADAVVQLNLQIFPSVIL